MSMGTPVVATAAGGTGEIVDSDVGELLPVAIDAQSAAKAIIRVVDSPKEMRRAAIERWRTVASTEVAQKALNKIISQLLN